MENFIITIERGYGSHGKQIAKALARDLGVEYFEDSIAKRASEMSGINVEQFIKMETSPKSGVSKRLEFIESGTISTGRDQFKPENLYNIEAKVLRDYAENHSMVVAAITGNRIFKNYPNCLKLNLQVSQKVAVKRLVEYRDVTEESAEEIVKRNDQFRTDFYKYFTGHAWRDGKYYDYTINVSNMTVEHAVEIIKMLLEDKMASLK